MESRLFPKNPPITLLDFPEEIIEQILAELALFEAIIQIRTCSTFKTLLNSTYFNRYRLLFGPLDTPESATERFFGMVLYQTAKKTRPDIAQPLYNQLEQFAQCHREKTWAQFLLGVTRVNKLGRPLLQFEAGVRFLHAGIEAGDCFAAIELIGLFMRDEFAVEVEASFILPEDILDKIIKILEVAEQQGNIYARHYLGRIFSDPELKQLSSERAINYLKNTYWVEHGSGLRDLMKLCAPTFQARIAIYDELLKLDEVRNVEDDMRGLLYFHRACIYKLLDDEENTEASLHLATKHHNPEACLEIGTRIEDVMIHGAALRLYSAGMKKKHQECTEKYFALFKQLSTQDEFFTEIKRVFLEGNPYASLAAVNSIFTPPIQSNNKIYGLHIIWWYQLAAQCGYNNNPMSLKYWRENQHYLDCAEGIICALGTPNRLANKDTATTLFNYAGRENLARYLRYGITNGLLAKEVLEALKKQPVIGEVIQQIENPSHRITRQPK